jgi:hypothetical protein
MNGWQIMQERAAANRKRRKKDNRQKFMDVRLHRDEPTVEELYAVLALFALGAVIGILWMVFA